MDHGTVNVEEFRDDMSFCATSDVRMSIQHSSENNEIMMLPGGGLSITLTLMVHHKASTFESHGTKNNKHKKFHLVHVRSKSGVSFTSQPTTI